MSFGWHPREHRKALDGMLSLTLEERGAYNTCLDLIYDREGPIPDDSRWLAGWMGVSARKWSTIRASLVIKGKLFEITVNNAPCLMNQRAAIEIENQSKLSRKLRENGAKGGRSSVETRTKSNENNYIAEALAQAGLKLKTETKTKTKTKTKTVEDTPAEPNGSAAPRGVEKRGARIPDDFNPDLAAAEAAGLTLAQAAVEADKFLDYWRAVPGGKGRKLDWPATWRNWTREAVSRNPRYRQSHERPHHDAKFAARQENLASHERGADLAARLYREP